MKSIQPAKQWRTAEDAARAERDVTSPSGLPPLQVEEVVLSLGIGGKNARESVTVPSRALAYDDHCG